MMFCYCQADGTDIESGTVPTHPWESYYIGDRQCYDNSVLSCRSLALKKTLLTGRAERHAWEVGVEWG
ncbi:hypothetical protein E2C01_097153 [Portunus trituberculatus]|uniref:Uncharacterized protein n=1 Tax=Portunus trituberculatus TaxID=210409 RepID=A0A5B7K988_PORTR|nr:hypothetical protein [Portunus trituberculatus]